jgi:hypothetical protein
VKGTFTLQKPSGHTNYYGLVFGGSDLEGPNQNYLYFLVAQDGTWLVKRRSGDKETQNVADKAANDAVKKPDATGQSTNTLEVRVTADKIENGADGEHGWDLRHSRQSPAGSAHRRVRPGEVGGQTLFFRFS